jgi:hypothetical protein
MRIAFVIPNLGAGGAERVASLLCNEWVRTGHEVSAITFEPRGAKPVYVLTTEGVCLNDEEKHQIEESNVVWDAGDDGSDGSTAQSASGLRGTPPSAIVYAVLEFIRVMSA